ncbi:MAG: hypothetical protein KDM81_19535, partial [Verrucomicrobiae bacterium]|nr:hypothetical protein [Verrucomicrobiae bacterium]
MIEEEAELSQGRWRLRITPETAGRNLQFVADNGVAHGESNPFHVFQPLQFTLALPVRDVVWPVGADSFLASIPDNASEHAGEIVRVDPETGLVETFAVVSGGLNESLAGRMALAPAGDLLFVVTGNGGTIQALDTATGGLWKQYSLPAGEAATDLAVAMASPFRVLVAVSGGEGLLLDEQMTGIRIPSDQGSLPALVVARPSQPETFLVGAHFAGVYEWRTGPAGLLERRFVWGSGAMPMAVVGDRMFLTDRGAIDLDSGELLGLLEFVESPYNDIHSRLIAADARRGEVVTLQRVTDNRRMGLWSYHAGDLGVRRTAILPIYQLSTPQRLVVGDGRKAVLVADNTAHILQWPPGAAGAEAANLALTATSLTQEPRIGAPWIWHLSVTNAGAAEATDLLLRYHRPEGMEVL